MELTATLCISEGIACRNTGATAWPSPGEPGNWTGSVTPWTRYRCASIALGPSRRAPLPGVAGRRCAGHKIRLHRPSNGATHTRWTLVRHWRGRAYRAPGSAARVVGCGRTFPDRARSRLGYVVNQAGDEQGLTSDHPVDGYLAGGGRKISLAEFLHLAQLGAAQFGGITREEFER